MFTKFLSMLFMALAFWAVMEIISILFGLRKMEIGSWEWWVACGVFGINSVELAEYFIERKKKKKVDGEG